MATLISLVALSVDAMLPALPNIASDLGAKSANEQQLIISALLFGLSLGQFITGPLSDSFGRIPVIQAGLFVFLAGTLLSLLSTDLTTMLAGRVLQGLGAAGPRVVTIALLRDQYEGRAMARVLSFIMTIFILVPALAPAIGQTILIFAHWRAIFVLFLALAGLGLVWLTQRQEETHPPERRLSLSLTRVASAMFECIRHPISRCYILAGGLVFGAFVGFLTSVQQIFADVYGVGEWFPAYFAVLALGIGAASIMNANLVMRFGMRLLSQIALSAMALLAVIGLAVAFATNGQPPLLAFIALMLAIFFCFGVIFGNFNALAMEPMGHIAGTASAVIAGITSFIAVSIGTLIGQNFDGTVEPLIGGFTTSALLSLALILWTGWRYQRWRQPGSKASNRI